MARFQTTRTTLGLYGVVLVLPTLVFGWLYWRELVRAHEVEMAAVPEDAEDGARRILTSLGARLEELIRLETQRPFTDYGKYVLASSERVGDELVPQRSDMTERSLPEGVLAYFWFDRKDPTRPPEVFAGRDTFGRKGIAETYASVVEEYRGKKENPQILAGVEPARPRTTFPLPAVALCLGDGDLRCFRECAPLLADRVINVIEHGFRRQFFVDANGAGRVIVSRRVRAIVYLEDHGEVPCLAGIGKGFEVQQGFLLDVDWLLKRLPFRFAEQVLSANELLVRPDASGTMDKLESRFATLYPVEWLEFETFRPEDLRYGKLDVEIDTSEISARFEHQQRNLLILALMLVVTLGTGMTLMVRSVNRELEQARRTQNFVAAVTHELRTPVSAIRLHGEMLLEGWASDEAKKQEYYRRIVRECGRLSTLVENVLEKSKLKEKVTEPELSDLNATVQRIEGDLASPDDREDLVFEYAPRLPRVWLTAEGVRGILLNLVENARKYAPVDPGGEPIRVRTRWDGERAVLEVADRGPGVPAEERERIFEAFYRVGSEATRTTTGTGLGLHLVRLHADVAGARIAVEDRSGGGSVFQVAFRAET